MYTVYKRILTSVILYVYYSNLTVENLMYLTSEQALADTANFIRQMTIKYNLTTNQKWFLFGGSYAGALSIWFADIYPNMVSGVIASSGPVSPTINFKGKKKLYNFRMYMRKTI